LRCNMLLRILDIVGSLLIIISVWNLQKARWWWLMYIAGCLMFAVIFVITWCPAAIILELTLSAVSIRNFRNFGRKTCKKQK